MTNETKTPCGCANYCDSRPRGLYDCGCGWGELCEVGPLFRIVPDEMIADGVRSAVVRTVAYPAGQHPAGCPIASTMTAVEVRTASGGVRWFGADDAWIGSDLRMHLGPVNPRDEVRMAWDKSPGR